LVGRLSLVRATHLNDYISVLRSIGAPVDRDLAASKLPARIEETPDLYVSIPIVLEWGARCGRDLAPMELGLLAARHASLASLRPAHQAAIVTAQTGFMRLKAMALIARHEDTALDVTIRQDGDTVRVICDMVGLRGHPFICLAEWLNLQAVISVLRSVAGDDWCPDEMCFMSSDRPPDAVLAAFPNTRFRMGQPQSSVTVGLAALTLPTDDMITAPAHDAASSAPEDAQSEALAFFGLLRMMLQPYLGEGRTDVAFAAEMAGVSTRTLQRRLGMCGTSYRQVLQEARFDLARSLLDDNTSKVIEIAMIAGYDTPQHFTRAFRRFTGVTPSQYRAVVKGKSLLSDPSDGRGGPFPG
jgi:AraC-like DNA-binding protein